MGLTYTKFISTFLLLFTFFFGVQAFAQQIVIDIEGMNPTRKTGMGISTSYSTGLNNVGRGEHVYLSAYDFAGSPVTTLTWEFVSKPGTSTTVFEVVNDTITKFLADVVGQYKVKATVTTPTGTAFTEIEITAANYTGVEMSTGPLNCGSCHSDIRNIWKDSKHATLLKRGLDGEVAGFSASRLRTSTTGVVLDSLNNGSFGSLMKNNNWQFPTTLQPGNWDAMKTSFPAMARVGTIGCESCHGAGSQHPSSGAPSSMTVSYSANSCMNCHNNLPNVRQGSQWESSGHGNAVWSNSFQNRAGNNALSDCVRCHDGRGYVNFTNNIGTNTSSAVYTRRQHVDITCQSCHDPHKGGLRSAPVASDTLSNGFSYAALNLGFGKTCMDCHKYRANGNTLVNSNLSANWGPHYAGIADVMLGKNGYTFGHEIPSTIPHQNLENTCVSCHMATPEATHRNKMGEHTFKMSYVDNNNVKQDLVQSCIPCHGNITSFSQIMAFQDYNNNGQIETYYQEFDKLFYDLKMNLPPIGEPTVNWALIDNSNITMKGAYFNYRYVNYEKSKGIHNPKYVIGLLQKSLIALTGQIPVELTSFTANINDNYEVVLNWVTNSELNNFGFEVERATASTTAVKDWVIVGFVEGKGTTTETNIYSFTDNSVKSGSYSYRLKQVDFDGKFIYTESVEVNNILPNEFSLNQNYPNPFNPSTVISYQLPVTADVTLKIYDILGNEVQILVNQKQEAGKHEVKFDASNLTTGIYFYSINAGNFSQTKKMILLR